jgi:SAM-dependent methyltransferase
MDLALDTRTREPVSEDPAAGPATCRFCGTPLHETFVDLGLSPLCETYPAADELDRMEPFYPLHVKVCEQCLLVQLREYVQPDRIFSEYAYFSSYSEDWLAHARRYVEEMVERFGLTTESRVIEVASNDGYLLRNFVERGIPVLGIEPAANVAAVAEDLHVPTIVRFFGVALAEELVARGESADLVIGNNVLAQVPDVNDFVAGLRRILAPGGVVTLEFPHLLRLVEENQFDTIYHEHFSYFSFAVVEKILAVAGLRVVDVEELPTHGGSLRVFAQHAGRGSNGVRPRVEELRRREEAAGMDRLDFYRSFGPKVERTKHDLLELLIDAKRAGKSVVGYGAPGKGNTLLNYCGIRTDLLAYTVDRNAYKQGRFLPGTHIPIHHPDRIRETRPDVVLILPWNLKDEIVRQLSFIADWGGRFAVPIPQPALL